MLLNILLLLFYTWAPVFGIIYIVKKRNVITNEIRDLTATASAEISQMSPKKRIGLLVLTPMVSTLAVVFAYYMTKFEPWASSVIGEFIVGPLSTDGPKPAPLTYSWDFAFEVKLWIAASCIWVSIIICPPLVAKYRK